MLTDCFSNNFTAVTCTHAQDAGVACTSEFWGQCGSVWDTSVRNAGALQQ